MTERLDTPGDLQRGLRWLTRSTVAVYIVLIVVSLYFWNDARETRRAVCAFRDDLGERVAQSEAFLADHPEGFGGISTAQIRTSLDGQRRTITALAPLDC